MSTICIQIPPPKAVPNAESDQSGPTAAAYHCVRADKECSSSSGSVLWLTDLIDIEFTQDLLNLQPKAVKSVELTTNDQPTAVWSQVASQYRRVQAIGVK